MHFNNIFMHYRCVLYLLQCCVLVGLDWAEPEASEDESDGSDSADDTEDDDDGSLSDGVMST